MGVAACDVGSGDRVRVESGPERDASGALGSFSIGVLGGGVGVTVIQVKAGVDSSGDALRIAGGSGGGTGGLIISSCGSRTGATL
jgi:hypothetical protein